jgi:hypothetical protein
LKFSKGNLIRIISWGVFCLLASDQAISQTLTTLRTSSARVAVNVPLIAFVDFTPEQNNWCGFFIDWGDGEKHQSFRIGKSPDINSPVSRDRSYSRPGSYTIRAYGAFVSKGLNSAEGCKGAPKSVTVTVIDPVAEQLRAKQMEVQKANEIAAKAKLEADKSKKTSNQESSTKPKSVKSPPPPVTTPSPPPVKPSNGF